MNNFKKPLTGLAGLKENWKDDLKSGFNISLIALPLCLGIAIASGFPPSAGLFAAIVGGLLVSRINGSYLTITGPAAGLIVVNLTAVETLGNGDHAVGYPYALAAIVVGGLIVALLGFLKAGKLGDFFPTSAVHGMLAAIGVIIMSKQFFVMLGVKAQGHEFHEIVSGIPSAIQHANPEVAAIGLTSLAILIVYPFIKWKFIKLVPAPIWVLGVAIPMCMALDFEHEHTVTFLGMEHKVGWQFLVHLPNNIGDAITFPDFSKIGELTFWGIALTIGLVTAIESLLSTLAVDSLDPWGRKSNLNKDVAGVGIGSSVSALIGGLPMISEIVRSSANVNGGGRTQWSNFFHAVFLVAFMVLLKPLIELIPLAALAAMLVFTGYRLASPKEFVHIYQIGKGELVIFVFTMLMVLFTDLLIGIFAGIALNLVMNVFKGTSLSNLFKAKVTEEVFSEDCVMLSAEGVLGFTNYLSLKSTLMKYDEKKIINIDLADVTMLDHTTMHHIQKLQLDRMLAGKELNLIDDEHLNPVSGHPMAERRANVGAFTAVLNGRAQELLDFANDQGWNFTPAPTAAIEMWGNFPSFLGKTLQWKKNILTKDFGPIHMKISDLVFKSGAMLTAHEHQMTALLIDFGGIQIPAFTLEKEQLFDKLLGKAGWADINFENHPEFSDFYLLKGENESYIRSYFTEALILFLEANKGYHIESNGRSLMVYKDQRLMHAKDLHSLVMFSKGVIKRIKAEPDGSAIRTNRVAKV